MYPGLPLSDPRTCVKAAPPQLQVSETTWLSWSEYLQTLSPFWLLLPGVLAPAAAQTVWVRSHVIVAGSPEYTYDMTRAPLKSLLQTECSMVVVVAVVAVVVVVVVCGGSAARTSCASTQGVSMCVRKVLAGTRRPMQGAISTHAAVVL